MCYLPLVRREVVVSGAARGPATSQAPDLPEPGLDQLPGRPQVKQPQPSRVSPIVRAGPAMLCVAVSMSLAFRSGILVWAMSLTCAIVILPTFSLCGSELPFCTPAAFLISSAAGGVLVMNENERSS